MNTKTLYFMTRIAFAAVFAMGLLLVPAFNSTGTVSAQREKREIAGNDLIWQALNLKSASSYSAFAEDGIADNGRSLLKGDVGVARPSASIKGINGGNVTSGLVKDTDSNSLRVKKDVSNSFSMINQLPCTEVADTNLGGRKFGPGVYCLASADLAGEMVLDAQDDISSTFIFVIAGGFNAGDGSSVSLVNKAHAANVFFVANDTTTVGEGSRIKGNLFARGSIKVGSGTTVEGRALSLAGDISLSDSILAPEAGVLEICKNIDTTLPAGTTVPGTGGTAGTATGLENNIFLFDVGQAAPIAVAANTCSGQIVLAAGPLTITELTTGRGIAGFAFNPNFQLINVVQNTNLGQPNTTALTGFNLPLRQAFVTIVDTTSTAGSTSDQTRITFTNRFAITGVIEICKTALDSGVSGPFQFTVNGLVGAIPGTTPAGNTGNSTVGTTGAVTSPGLALFNVFTGQCSGEITVTVPSTNTPVAPGTLRTGQVTVNELLRTGFIFTSATTAFGTAGAPNNINRFINFNVFGSAGSPGVPATNPTTGATSTTPIAGNATAVVVQGPASIETMFFFNNRTAPGQLKVCKVAGPGIAEGTPFNFTVTGIEPLPPVAVDTPFTTSNGSGGTNVTPSNGLVPFNGTLRNPPAPGAVPQGGTATTRNVTVPAGLPIASATFPPSGGFCQILPTTYVVDTLATITELIDTQVQVVGTNLLADDRVTRITSSTGIQALNLAIGAGNVNPVFNPTATLLVQPNVPFFPLQGGLNTNSSTISGTNPARPSVTVPIRRGVTEVEFVDAAFLPEVLKICKIAATPSLVGTPFTFTVTADTVGGLLAPFTSTVTVTAGAPGSGIGGQNGNCAIVPGPFGGGFGTNGTGGFINGQSSFNFNSSVLITETPTAGVRVQAGGITSQGGTTGVIGNTTTGTAQVTSMANAVNVIQFVNEAIPAQGPAPARRKKTLLAPTGGNSGN